MACIRLIPLDKPPTDKDIIDEIEEYTEHGHKKDRDETSEQVQRLFVLFS